MTLPGKLTIGFLQEDNPQKSYFRVRPLLIQDEGGYHPTENVKETYLEDGFIRIVPDKNEQSHFKTRMRTLGRYCAIDLRKHPGENDKIRPNKNHNGENGDRNAYIVYSDVITAVAPLLIAEIVEVDEDGLFPAPGTKLVALKYDGALKGIYQWDERGEQGAFIVGENLTNQTLSEENAIELSLPDGVTVRVLADLPRLGASMSGPVEVVERTEAPKLVPVPKAEPAVAPVPAPKAEVPAVPAVQTEPVSVPAAPVVPAAPQTEAVVEAAPEKPWIQRSTVVIPRVIISKTASPQEQSMAAQSGFNPKRGLSLKDIIDDKWRQSRYDQLGHEVVGDVTASPLESPVDQAMEAFRDAWNLPEARDSLIAALLRLDKMDEALGANGAPDAEQMRALNAGEQQMLRLEADRLRLLGDIDELKRLRQDKRTELINELRRTHSAEFDQTERRNRELLEAQQNYAEQSEQTRKAAEAIGQEFVQQLGVQIDQKMTEHLLSGRAMDLMATLSRRPCGAANHPQSEEMSAGELISAVRVRFGEAGITLSNDEAVNLLTCLTLGRIMIVSGESGSGKSEFVRTLAAALGIAETDSDCFAEIQAQSSWRSLGEEIEKLSPNGVAQVRLPEIKRLLENRDYSVPALLMIDGANRASMDCYLGEMLSMGEKGARSALTTGAGRIKLGDNLRLMLTVQDSGMALSGEMLDRAWTLRLSKEDADSDWMPASCALPHPEAAISMETLKKVFKVGAELPGEVTERMRILRSKLAEAGMLLSRRTLTDLYNYCSAALPYMRCKPLEVFDYAFSQRVMPVLMATADLDALHALPKIIPDMPRSFRLLGETLPLPTL